MRNSHMPRVEESTMLNGSITNLQKQISKGSPFKSHRNTPTWRCCSNMSFRMPIPSPWSWILWIVRPNEMPSCIEALKVRSRGGLKHQIPLNVRISSLPPCRTWEMCGTKEPQDLQGPCDKQLADNASGTLWLNPCTLCGAQSSAPGFSEYVLISCVFFNTENVKKKEFIFYSYWEGGKLCVF